uniref:Uncharacterized protein n=1 Tax=Helianthus annuus TaxID=4232 RepID=A0A251SIZ0_HELAN
MLSDVVTNILNQVTYHTEQPKVASDWSSCLGCVVVVCPCVGHLLCLPYEHCLKLFNYASATCYCFKLETLNSELDIC